MPIYEYKCNMCGKISEFLVGIGRDETSEFKCEYCGSKELTKVFSKSHVSKSNHTIGQQKGKTCCGRDERCDTPPCSDDGICKR